MSQSELADLLNISPSTYSRLERNESSVDFEQLTNFAKILDIPIQEFLPDTLSVNSHHNTQGGVVFGSYNYYSSSDNLNNELVKENENLKVKLDAQEEIIAILKSQVEDLKALLNKQG
jgi:transcriptional regulator with XRE-family HTH domain